MRHPASNVLWQFSERILWQLRDAEEGQASARRAIDQLQGELNARVAALEDVKKGVQPSLSDGDRLQSEVPFPA